MKTKLLILFLALIASEGRMFATEGALNGVFSISADEKVQFSQGNLQYQASTKTWRFAEHQWNTIGGANANISDTYTGWIDMFGWGTGNNPTFSSEQSADYSTFVDWGINKISNGGNVANTWSTLTREEQLYIFVSRPNAANLFGFGTVNNVAGLIILPDKWSTPAGLTFIPSSTKGLDFESELANWNYHDIDENSHYEDNIYSSDQWAKMESAGAAFLPATGGRKGIIITGVGSHGDYWSATKVENINNAYDIDFRCYYLGSYTCYDDYYFGRTVRLVRKGVVSHIIKFVNEDGTILEEKEVAMGAMPTYTGAIPTKAATAEYTYTFAGWTPEMVAVTGEATYTAQFTSTLNKYVITFVDWDGTILKSEEVDYNNAATAPENPTREGYDFIGWDKSFDHITENMTVTATYEIGQTMQYHLTFVNSEDEIFDQVITIKVPAAPLIEGFTFVKWQIVEKDFVDSIIVEAIYSYNSDPTSAPAEVVNPANKAQKLIREGNVYILHEGKSYSVQGLEVK